jgi:hypothetical protein
VIVQEVILSSPPHVEEEDDVIDALIDEVNDRCGVLLNALGRIPEHIPVCARKKRPVA